MEHLHFSHSVQLVLACAFETLSCGKRRRCCARVRLQARLHAWLIRLVHAVSSNPVTVWCLAQIQLAIWYRANPNALLADWLTLAVTIVCSLVIMLHAAA